MRKSIILILLFISSSCYCFDWSSLTDKDKTIILKSLKLYQAMQSGNYTIRTISTTRSNENIVKRREMLVAGLKFQWTYIIGAEKQRKNSIYVTAGSGLMLSYIYRLSSIFSFSANIGYSTDILYLFGAGVSF